RGLVVHRRITLEPQRGGSSGAAQPLVERLVRGEDAGDGFRLGRGVPRVEFEGAAEDDAVRTGEHITVPTREGVADLRLRQEDGELAARGAQLLVVEQGAAAEAGAVEHQDRKSTRLN